MSERPILFSGPMVSAILGGRKTQTRRVVKPQPDNYPAMQPEPRMGRRWVFMAHSDKPGYAFATCDVQCPYGVPGDRLWVRETFRPLISGAEYRAGVPEADWPAVAWKPAIHMPRWASRLTLEVVNVRVERLQEISEADAGAEGFEARPFPGPWWQGYRDFDGELLHQEYCGEAPPDWMIEPKRMKDTKHLDRSAVDGFRGDWFGVHGGAPWESNPWVWVIEFKRAK